MPAYLCNHKNAWVCGDCGQLIGEPPLQIITIQIVNGRVARVNNLPDGYNYRVEYQHEHIVVVK